MDELDCTLHDRDAGVPGQRAHGLQGPPVRRRRAALGERHAHPSADADDRCQPRPRAAGAAGARRGGARAAASRPRRPSRDGRLGGCDPRAVRRAARRGRLHRDRRRGRQRRSVSPRRSGARPAAGVRRLGPGDRAAAQFRHRRIERRGFAAARCAASTRSSRAAARRRPTRRWRRSSQPAARRAASIRSRSRTVATPRSASTSPAGPSASGRPRRIGRCWSTARQRPTPSPPRRRGRGALDIGARLETLLAAIARALVERGARRLIVAGGETSGACVQSLGVERLRIGAQIDPGVPWCHAAPALAPGGLHLALKSGNFGGTDFFHRAFTVAT